MSKFPFDEVNQIGKISRINEDSEFSDDLDLEVESEVSADDVSSKSATKHRYDSATGRIIKLPFAEETESLDPPVELRPAGKSRIFVYIASKVLLILLGASLIVLLVAMRDVLTVEGTRRIIDNIDSGFASTPSPVTGFEFEYDKENTFYPIGNGVGIVSSCGVQFFSEYGIRDSFINILLRSPCSRSNGKSIAFFEKGGSRLWVADGNRINFENDFISQIISVSQNSGGMLAVTTADEGFTSAVHIFDSGYNKIYTYHSAFENLISAALPNSGRQFMVSSVSFKDAGLTGEACLLSSDSEAIIKKLTFENELPISLKYRGKGYSLITDTALHMISEDGEITGSFNFGEERPVMFCDGLDGYTALLLTSGQPGSRYSLVTVDAYGKLIAKTETSSAYVSLSGVENFFASFTEEGVTVLDRSLKTVKYFDFTELSPPKKVIATYDGRLIAAYTDRLEFLFYQV